VIAFPPGTTLLTANHRLHWAPRNARTQALRAAAKARALQMRIPRIERAMIAVEYDPPPQRKADRHPLASQRVTDSGNLWPTAKALLDGIVDAGVLGDDDKTRVAGEACAVTLRTHPRGRLRLRITELPPADAEAA
jgi:hypothetical protein